MLQYISDSEAIIRELVLDQADPVLRYAFDFSEDTDVGLSNAGPLFKQDADFVLFESEVDNTFRAGPSQVSPTRCQGILAITLFTKDGAKALTHARQLEDISYWFANKTIRLVRFRPFTPLSTTRVMGFTAYSGVINFDFELQPR